MANINFKDIIGALFPGGSITGAPKERSIEIIDEIGEETPPEVARKLSPYIMSQLLKGQGQMLLGDGSVAQTTDAKFDEQITSHLKARGGVTIGPPQTSISRPFQPAAPVAAGQNQGIKKGGGK